MPARDSNSHTITRWDEQGREYTEVCYCGPAVATQEQLQEMTAKLRTLRTPTA
jgi:uncharacterized protein YkwD